jgi:hypothetical protein
MAQLRASRADPTAGPAGSKGLEVRATGAGGSDLTMKQLALPAILILTFGALVAFSTGRQEEAGEPETAEKPVPEYVGARKCKVCHLDIYKSWEETKHAWAFSSLKEEETENPGCVACHTTGFGRGGYGSGKVVANLAGVQCEECHGPGSLYSRSSVMRDPELSIEMGLARVDSTTCVTCHNSESPTFKGFAYEAGLSTGTHSRKRSIPD